jgi:PAS domain S-box-containing protein
MPRGVRVPGNTAMATPQNEKPLVTPMAHRAAVYAGALVVWYLLAALGLRYILPPSNVTLIWLSSGITVGLLLITPSAHRILLLAVIVVLHAVTNAAAGHSAAGAVIIAVAYGLEALVIVSVYERLTGGHDRSLTTIRSVLTFCLAGAIGVPAVTGLFGAIMCRIAYGPIDIGEAWFIWFVTDALGIILFAPVIVVWSRWDPSDSVLRGVRSAGTFILSIVVSVLLLEILIGTHLPVGLPVFSRAYLTFPLVFLFTYWFGSKGTTASLLAVAGVMLWNALDGPWSLVWVSEGFPRVVTVQLFIVVLAMSGLSFAALLKERAMTLERLHQTLDHQRDLGRRLEIQVERLPLGLIVLDRAGVIREWNPAAEVILGYAAHEVTGSVLNERVIPLDRRAAFLRLQDEVTMSDRSVRSITQAVRKDGTQIQIEWNATPLRGEAGKLTGLLVTAQDVTERGRSEKKIQRLNRLYAFLSQINQSIVRARSRTELFDSVCAVAVQHGKFRFAWIGELKPGVSVIEPVAWAGEGAAYLDAVRNVRAVGEDVRRTPMASAIQTQQVEVIQRAATDPRLIPWHEQVRACGFSSSVALPLSVTDTFNGCLEVFAIEPDYFDAEEMAVLQEIRGDLLFALTNLALDTTVRHTRKALRESEDDLRASRELFSNLFNLSPMPTSFNDVRTGTIVDVNRAFEEWTGYTRKELIGQAPGALGLFGNPVLRENAVQQLFRDGSVVGAELEIRLRNGQNRLVEVYAKTIELGEKRYVITITLDVTERKQAEDALREERSLLARRIEERTSELSLANIALAQASRLKDEFLASMSHELRTPLTAILGMAEALQMQVYGAVNDRQGKAVRTIEESGQHLLKLINDILDLSKIEAGKLELQEDQVAVRDICERALGMVRPAATSKRQQITFVQDERVTTMRADPRRLTQVLVNILSNAVKFTLEAGSITLDVRGDEANARVTFACIDTGIGIAPEDLQKLFHPFVQLDSRLSREYSGSGLGLSLAHRIVELHGGSMSVESTPGNGSVFTVVLPWRTAGPVAIEAALPPSAATDHVVPAASSRPLLLIADDNETTLSLYTDFFQDSGYDIALAHDGTEAIHVAGERDPSAVLMDVQMPGVDGLAATRAIREAEQRGQRRHVPIVALTALSMPGDRERCLAAGADVYISKPVDLKKLEKVVSDLIDGGVRP